MKKIELDVHDGQAVAEALSNFINVGDSEESAKLVEYLAHRDHRTLQQSLFRLVIYPYILAQGKKREDDCDLRNEATVKECRRIVGEVKAHWGTEYPPLPFV